MGYWKDLINRKKILIWIRSPNLFPQIELSISLLFQTCPASPPFASPRPEKDTRRFSVRRVLRDRGFNRASEAEAFRGTKWVTQGPHVSSDVDVNTRLGPVIPVIFLQGIHNSTDLLGVTKKTAWETHSCLRPFIVGIRNSLFNWFLAQFVLKCCLANSQWCCTSKLICQHALRDASKRFKKMSRLESTKSFSGFSGASNK